jgi:uncharacterized OB-fold protein
MNAGLHARVLDPALFHRPAEAAGRGDLEPPVLAGSQCRRDATLVFPAQGSCPRCSGREVTTVALPTRGTLWSWTVQHFAPKAPFRGPIGEDFVPYPLGYVDLGPVIVQGRLQADPARLWIGLPMVLSWLTAWTEPDGAAVLTYAFTPAPAGQEPPR